MDDKLSRIVQNPIVLEDEHVPKVLAAREVQEAALAEALTPPRPGARPTHLWIHGPPGVGKSTAVKRALAGLEERHVRTAYVNGWSAQTFYAVLETIFQELRALIPEKREVAFKYDRLGRIARERRLVIVLDEIDQMLVKERDATAYNLSRLDHSQLICLSQSRKAFLDMDSRVRSRLMPRFVHFPAYQLEELVQLLEDRARTGLAPASWCTADLEQIAATSEGDARVAIQTLRVAAYLAEKAHAAQLRRVDLAAAHQSAGAVRRQYLLKSLSEHHRIIFHLVRSAGKIDSSRAWQEYLSTAKAQDIAPMRRRTFTQYVLQLLNARLLEEVQGPGRRNRRLLRVVEPA